MSAPNSLPNIGTLHGTFAQFRVEPETVTLFEGWTRWTTNNHGEMNSDPLEGFFCAETRLMTVYRLLVNGKPVSHRVSTQLSAREWTSIGALLNSGESGNLPLGTLPKGAIEIRIFRTCGKGLSEQIFIKNNGMASRPIHLELRIACPIMDSEFSEEMKKDRKGPLKGVRPTLFETDTALGLRFERNFGRRKRTPVEEFRQLCGTDTPADGDPVWRGLEIQVSPRDDSPRTKIRIQGGKETRIHAQTELGPREELCLQLTYEPLIEGMCMKAPLSLGQMNGLSPVPRDASPIPQDSLRFNSSNSMLNQIVGQAMNDLYSLRLPLFEQNKLDNPEKYVGCIAGVPRYIGLFGRDTVIASWQSILFEPQFLEPALSRVALFQGVKYDPWRDEEPARMLHERRLDPKAELGDMNRNLYYGDVTSTPFWILAFSSLYQWTGERDLIQRHQSTVEKCCQWILRRLEEGNGFLYYCPALSWKSDENRNQAWKDSGDGIVDEHGRVCVPPLAVAEVQGYVYQALLEAADLLNTLESSINTKQLQSVAFRLKQKFNESFWVEDQKFYALALDQKGNPLMARASNIGHCLTTDILESSRIDAVVNGLMSEDLFSGWGIRTLSADNAGYDPFSYHRGSVWPVENAIIADGMALWGYRKQSNQIITSQLCLAGLYQNFRLPEVFAGQPRSPEYPVPGIYNFANLLQAWSVSAVSQFVQTFLGIRPRADQGVLYLDPDLPHWLDSLVLENLRVGTSRLKIRFQRDPRGESSWEVLEQVGKIRVESRKMKVAV